MATRKDVKYKISQNVETSIPLVSQGKFRLKKRNDIQDFGVGFAPRINEITRNSYLEWQIGYDTIIGKDQKNTALTGENFEFIGANGKRKYPYELSEILFYMCRHGVKEFVIPRFFAEVVLTG